ncbi:MAG: RluA family pseudouridine synthase [Candidatus Omnitrophica bacterium]|nr:RluA family pseudouridine synthase [Candidatus Omnitrophota bacterium]MBU1871774.1 RluA family pseudouridine synthase [Candidatus Omnitrophota bacterium]
MAIPVIYEDNWLLVVNKPPGLLTIPSPKEKNRTLIKILNEDLKKKGAAFSLHACHRLDRHTSGLIILAKGKSIQQKMMQEFKKKAVNKVYIAVVDGLLAKAQGEINTPLSGKSALTRYKAICRFKDFSVLRVSPLTGRKNQIRLHFKQIGHPVIGESRFAFRRDFKIKSKKLCLHAQGLRFLHPVTGKEIHLETELPAYFNRFLK